MLATAKQVDFITKLSAERAAPVPAKLPAISKREASAIISALLAMPRPAKVASGPAAEPLEVGVYRDDAGDIFKVQESATGNRYAKKLTPINGERLTDEDATIKFEWIYAPGAVKSLDATQRLTLDEAKAFGIRYGVCAVCGLRLKDAKSVALGIGPICITKLEY